MYKALYLKYKWYLIITVPMSILLGMASMSVIATLTEDLETAEKFFHLLPVLIVNMVIVMFGFAFMAYLSLQLLGIVLGFFLTGFLTIACLLWLTKKDRVAIRETSDVMMSHYQRVVLGAKELTLNRFRQHFFTRKIFITSDEIRRRGGRIFNLLALVEQWAQLLLFAMLGVIIFLVGNMMSLSMEVIAGYVITLLFLLEPIEVVISGFDDLIDARVAFNKIDSLQLSDVDGCGWGIM